MTQMLVRRFEDRDRLDHWAVALLYLAAALSGLAFFHPALFFLSALFGGGPWMRVLHPFLGLAMFVAFAFFGMAHRRDNRITDADREWHKHGLRLPVGDDADMPPAGKFNDGQKVLFWAIVACMLVLVADRLRVLAALVRPVLHDRPDPRRHAAARGGRHRPGAADHRPHLHGGLDQGLDPRHDPRHRDRGQGTPQSRALVPGGHG